MSDVRAIVAAALGHLHALETVPSLAVARPRPQRRWCGRASSRHGVPRQPMARDPRTQPQASAGAAASGGERPGGMSGGKSDRSPPPPRDPVELAVATLESALGRPVSAVRAQAALALGRIGPDAAAVAPRLIGLLQEADETVRCQAAHGPGRNRRRRRGDGGRAGRAAARRQCRGQGGGGAGARGV